MADTTAVRSSDPTPFTKEAGEPIEEHLERYAAATPLFDVDGYVEGFNRDIVAAYRAGVADVEWPADVGLARSIVPPGTSAVRDFSSLAPRIPRLIAEACVGCMACVNACPDTAIIGVAIPESDLDARLDAFSAADTDPAHVRESARSHFMRTSKYADVPAKKGLEPAAFGIFVDPVHCKGCAECVEVCAALGHDALVMIDKVADEGGGESTLQRYERDMRFFHTLPPTPAAYRNEKALADLMLGEFAFGYVGGAGSCAGCGEATAIRMLVTATRQVNGPESMGIVAATGCNTVFGSTYPFNPFLVPWTNSLFENAPAVALGVRARWDAAGHAARRLWALGGAAGIFNVIRVATGMGGTVGYRRAGKGAAKDNGKDRGPGARGT